MNLMLIRLQISLYEPHEMTISLVVNSVKLSINVSVIICTPKRHLQSIYFVDLLLTLFMLI